MGLFVRCAIQCGKLHKKNGGVAEWTKAAALKAVEGPVPSVGSNPTPSAIHCTRPPPRPPGRALFPWLVRPEGLMIDTSRRDVFFIIVIQNLFVPALRSKGPEKHLNLA